MRVLITIIYIIWLFITSYVLLLVDKIKPFSSEQVYKRFRTIAKRLNSITGNKYQVTGMENIPTEPVLIVANHESLLDPVTIVDIIEQPTALIGKIELTKVKILQHWAERFDSAFIDRDDMRQSMRVIMGASKTLKNGQNVCIFPEGTRDTADEEFKPGSFKIAQTAKAGILPITIRHTADVFENNKGLRLRKAKPQITIHPVVTYEQYQDKDMVTLASEVQAIVNSK